jgi:hypothetical protein
MTRHRAEWDARTQEYELRHESGETWFYNPRRDRWTDQDNWEVVDPGYDMRIRLNSGPDHGRIVEFLSIYP